jgi:hypothetical protein
MFRRIVCSMLFAAARLPTRRSAGGRPRRAAGLLGVIIIGYADGLPTSDLRPGYVDKLHIPAARDDREDRAARRDSGIAAGFDRALTYNGRAFDVTVLDRTGSADITQYVAFLRAGRGTAFITVQRRGVPGDLQFRERSRAPDCNPPRGHVA